MPWLIRDVVEDINKAVGRRWQDIDPLLPVPVGMPEGCAPPMVTAGRNGRPAGLGVCRHHSYQADSLSRTWATQTRFLLTARLREPDTLAALDHLLAQWSAHVIALPEASQDDTSAAIMWPSRDTTGVRALVAHGLHPFTVLAARQAPRELPADEREGRTAPGSHGAEADRDGEAGESYRDRESHRDRDREGDRDGELVIRTASADDAEAVTDLEMAVIRYDALFGGSTVRPETETLVRAATAADLELRPSWTWLAERRGRPVGLIVVQPPGTARWIAAMTRLAPVAYLQSAFVLPDERGRGVATALIRRVHQAVDAAGVAVTLLHHAQVNPLSGPFWYRMGYRPVWTTWEARPAAALR